MSGELYCAEVIASAMESKASSRNVSVGSSGGGETGDNDNVVGMKEAQEDVLSNNENDVDIDKEVQIVEPPEKRTRRIELEKKTLDENLLNAIVEHSKYRNQVTVNPQMFYTFEKSDIEEKIKEKTSSSL